MKKLPFKIGFKFKVNMGIMSIVFITALMIAISASHIVSSAMNTEYKNRGVAICLNLAMRSVDAILARDMLRSSRLIQGVASSADDILYAFIQDENGRLLVHTFSGGFPRDLAKANIPMAGSGCKVALLKSGNDLIYDFATPVMAGRFQVGTVRLGLLKTKVTRTINGLLWMIFGVTVISMFVADMVGFALADGVTRRVKALRKASEEVIRGNLDVRTGNVVERGCWEILNCANPDCPARGERELRCWQIKNKSEHEKYCNKCPVYREQAGDEIQHLAESFDAMTFTLKKTFDQLALSKETLAASEAKYKRIFETSMDMIFVADGRGMIRDINPAGRKMLGWNPKAGAHLADLFKTPTGLPIFSSASIPRDM